MKEKSPKLYLNEINYEIISDIPDSLASIYIKVSFQNHIRIIDYVC